MVFQASQALWVLVEERVTWEFPGCLESQDAKEPRDCLEQKVFMELLETRATPEHLESVACQEEEESKEARNVVVS
jgi:hypothetical protein